MAIRCRMHRISSRLRGEAAHGPVSTRVGDRLGRPYGAVSFSMIDLFVRVCVCVRLRLYISVIASIRI